MSLRLQRRSLHIERVAGEGSAETVAEGTVRIPDRYPPIGRALQLTAHPIVNNVEPTDDRVLIEGVVRLAFTYVSFEEAPQETEEDGERSVSERLQRVEWEDELSFAYLLEVMGATEESHVDVEARTSSVAYDVRGDDASVDVDVILKLYARLVETDSLDLTVGATGTGIEYEVEEVRVRSKLAEIETTGRVTAEVPLAGRSIPESILDVQIEPSLIEVTQGDGEVLIRGSFDCNCLYVGSEGAGPQYVEWPKGITFQLKTPSFDNIGPAAWESKVEVASVDYYVDQSSDGATLRLDIQLNAYAAAYRGEVISCVQRISSDEGEVACRIDEVQVYEAVGEGSTRSELQGVLELPDGLPPIERLLKGEARLVVDDVHVLGDKVAIEGQVAIDLMYVGRGEGGGEIHTARWPYGITVDMEVPIPGAEPGLDRNVSATVRRLEFDLINRETVEVRVQVAADARVGRMTSVETVVEAVEVPPEPADPPTFTFVVTTEDDTLWKLAQVYRTTPEAILAHNEWISEEEPLGRGRKVCIVR